MDSYVAEMIAFVEAIRSGSTVPVVGNDGRVPVLMAMAGMRSIGRCAENRPVRLDEIEQGAT